MQEPTIRHFYVKVNKSFVHLVQYGHHENIIKSAASPSSGNSSANSSSASSAGHSTLLADQHKLRKLIVFIPGNPGMLGVYHDFLSTLYKTLSNPSAKSEDPVILAISHNNFDHPDHCDYRADERVCLEENELNFVERSALEDNQDPHQVELQIMNKLIILKRLLKVNLRQADPDSCKIVFIGHSFGAYIALRLLQDRSIAQAHAGSILVHPALENLAKTEKGVVMARYLAFKADILLKLMAHVIDNFLPKSFKMQLTKWNCSPEFVKTSSSMVMESVAQMACPKSVLALVQMARSEFETVKDLDHKKLVKPHIGKLKLLYSIGDHWANEASRIELAGSYPELHIEEHQAMHAFIMDPNVVMNYAIKIGMFIQDFFE